MGCRVVDEEMVAMDEQVAAGEYAPVLGRGIGELWPDEGEGSRTPGRDIYDEGDGLQEAEELDEEEDATMLEAWDGADKQQAQDIEGAVWAAEIAQDKEGEVWSRDLEGEGGADESGGGSRKGGSGGVGGLLGKGMVGKGGGKVGGAAVGMVNATIRKPA